MHLDHRDLAMIGFPPGSRSRQILFAIAIVCACIAFTFTLVALLIALGALAPGVRWLFDPRSLWISLPIIAAIWLFCHFSEVRWHKVIAKSLQPWLIGMALAEAIFIAATRWLPRSHWDELLWIENISHSFENKLERLFPYSLIFNLFLSRCSICSQRLVSGIPVVDETNRKGS
jgi:hypothetical protein